MLLYGRWVVLGNEGGGTGGGTRDNPFLRLDYTLSSNAPNQTVTGTPAGWAFSPSLADVSYLGWWLTQCSGNDVTRSGITGNRPYTVAVDATITVPDNLFTDFASAASLLARLYGSNGYCQFDWGTSLGTLVSSGFDFTNGTVKNGAVGVNFTPGVPFAGTTNNAASQLTEILQDGAVLQTFTSDATRSPWSKATYTPTMQPPRPPEPQPALLGQTYRFQQGSAHFGSTPGNKSAVFQILPSTVCRLRRSLTVDGATLVREEQLPVPPLPIAAIFQNEQQVTDGLFDYRNSADGTHATVGATALGIKTASEPTLEPGSATYDASASFGFGQNLTIQWDGEMAPNTALVSTDATVVATSQSRSLVLRTATTPVRSTNFNFTNLVEAATNLTIGAVLMQDGARLLARVEGTGAAAGVVIRRFEKDSITASNSVTLTGLSLPRLAKTRDGRALLFAKSGTALLTYESTNGGRTWQ